MTSFYTISYYDEEILTLVTDRPSMVRQWIATTKYIHRYRLSKLVVGLDVEWRPVYDKGQSNPVATLQLCVGHRCLIFQILQAGYVPSSLVRFLEDGTYTFVGVGIDQDARRLYEDYGLEVSRTMDLRGLAVSRIQDGSLRNATLKGLCMEVLNKRLEKPKRITTSKWDSEVLSYDQVEYACLDAFVSFELGRVLRASS